MSFSMCFTVLISLVTVLRFSHIIMKPVSEANQKSHLRVKLRLAGYLDVLVNLKLPAVRQTYCLKMFLPLEEFPYICVNLERQVVWR